jgi:hypothetical protein
VVRTFEPGEDWFWDYGRQEGFVGPPHVGPAHHPQDQPATGPAGVVPADWQQHIH